jgi:hypothetical protein
LDKLFFGQNVFRQNVFRTNCFWTNSFRTNSFRTIVQLYFDHNSWRSVEVWVLKCSSDALNQLS